MLISECEKAREIVLSNAFEDTFDLNLRVPDCSDIDLNKLRGVKNAIYVIEQIDGKHKECFTTFENHRKQHSKDYNFAQINDNPCKVLYVGSSKTGLKSRIKEHLGLLKSKQKYALHLNKWFKGEIKIIVYVLNSAIKRNVLQIIEDAKSYDLKPAFGKRGKNNK